MVGGKRRFGWAAAVAATGTLLLGAGPAGAASPFVQAHGSLTDLAPGTANATDGASASLYAIAGGGYTTFVLFLSGLDPDAAGTTYGTHIHVGTCVPGNGAAAGPHYNTGGTPSTETEVWLDFEVTKDGTGAGDALVPFVPVPGERSVVIHAEATAPSGAAGPRLVCLPVVW